MKASSFLNNIWSNAVGCNGFHFYGFFIMDISVSLEKSTQFLYGIVWSWRRDSCAMLTFIHDGRGTSTYVHPYLRDERSSSFTATKHNLFFFTGDLGEFLDHFMIASVRCYTCNYSPRDCAQ
ncbi:uncharacterized protein LOC124341420 [Daphnia pulicaria]|uniref:uncharacterized protein LOC124341420 n=1 Tax=Daphnia pulicaria TaxID=35523 RepID=UPI001EEC17F5|nr:uncharacterized protein LOC124341420 [Daphnia pulicaria]